MHGTAPCMLVSGGMMRRQGAIVSGLVEKPYRGSRRSRAAGILRKARRVLACFIFATEPFSSTTMQSKRVPQSLSHYRD